MSEHQKIRIRELQAEINSLKQLGPCGHPQRFIHWEDHSQPIVCTLCEIKRLRKQLADCQRIWEDD